MNDRTLTYPRDNYWIERRLVERVGLGRSHLQKILRFDNFPETETISVECARGVSDDLGVATCLENRKTQIAAYSNIDKFNQLGIKDYLLGKSSSNIVDLHTRGAHSRGAAIIGGLYFSAIEPFIQHTIFGSIFKNEQNYFQKLMGFALYLHDVGHLPYSHLIEAVFDEINWTRIKGASHRHDEVPLQQLKEEERNGIKEAIGTCLNLSTEEEVDHAFEIVQDLIAGISGIPFLDAIVNSSVDADKIDYIFRDMEYTQTRARLREPRMWLTDFLSNVSLSPEGLVRLNGEASLCALELLEERQFLYRTLYHEPKMKVFEKISSVIITSWLTREISLNLLHKLKESSPVDNVFLFGPDVRKEKGDFAYERIVREFVQYTSKNELELLLKMCEDLVDDEYRDDLAKNWFRALKGRLESFRDVQSPQQLIKECNEMIVGDPFYIAKGKGGEDIKKAKEIVRNLYVDYPCGVLIDITELPSFLPMPKSRCFTVHNQKIIGETFLVPDKKPSEWSRNKIGKFPLHLSDFTSFEKEFAQVMVINTMPGEANGEYVLDLFIKRCRENSVNIQSSIWR